MSVVIRLYPRHFLLNVHLTLDLSVDRIWLVYRTAPFSIRISSRFVPRLSFSSSNYPAGLSRIHRKWKVVATIRRFISSQRIQRWYRLVRVVSKYQSGWLGAVKVKLHDHTESLEKVHDITLKPSFATLDADLRTLAKDAIGNDTLDNQTLFGAESKLVASFNSLLFDKIDLSASLEWKNRFAWTQAPMSCENWTWSSIINSSIISRSIRRDQDRRLKKKNNRVEQENASYCCLWTKITRGVKRTKRNSLQGRHKSFSSMNRLIVM